jgi:lipopolysaccharide transport system ATP-binding protein
MNDRAPIGIQDLVSDVQQSNPTAGDVVIRVQGLGKKYRIRHQRRERYTALRDVIADKLRGNFRRRRPAGDDLPPLEDFWALRDVRFDVRRGEVVGIIGRNGAGKSTLLKILSRITEPSQGRVELRGRVASLLEVGTGFHPELTGRENIYLNGAILGMSREEIRRKFDEIVSFAEVERFLDTPVKRYSSGMHVRLAFAVAAHVDPEILIVDEVLAVGDAAFQKKCMGKLHEASNSARTVLFVSHNMAAIQSLCESGVVLDAGRVAFHGEAADAVHYYLNTVSRRERSAARALSASLTLRRIEATPPVIRCNEKITIELELHSAADDLINDLALLIDTPGGERLALVDLRSVEGPCRMPSHSTLTLRCTVLLVPFVEADFSIGIYVSADSVVETYLNLLSFTVLPAEPDDGPVPRDRQFRGLVQLESAIERRLHQEGDTPDAPTSAKQCAAN